MRGRIAVPRGDEQGLVSDRLRRVTGWALLVGAFGILLDSASGAIAARAPAGLVSVLMPAGPADGSLGLIPAYLGTTVGLVGLVLVVHRLVGPAWAALTCVGVLGIFVFWYSYPARATAGGLGGIVLGVALLSLPSWGRFVSPVWVAGSLMGVPELVRPGQSWGPFAGFSLVGMALAVTGTFVLWGLRDAVPDGRSRRRRSSPPGSARRGDAVAHGRGDVRAGPA